MKRFLLSFILSVLTFVVTAAVMNGAVPAPSEPLQLRDSLDLFHDITDISKQVERRATQQGSGEVAREGDSLAVADSIPPVDILPDSIPPVMIPPDSIVPDTIPPAVIASDSLINDSIPPMVATPDSTLEVSSDSLPEPRKRIRLSFRNELDSIYLRRKNGTLQLPVTPVDRFRMQGLTFRDTLFYNPLFLPVIYTGRMIPRDISFFPVDEERERGVLIPQDHTLAPGLWHVDFVNDVRRDYYRNYPDKIRYSILQFDSIPRVESSDAIVKETFNPFRDLIKTETTYSLEAPGVDKATIDRKYWVRSGEHSFQFAQNYFSSNWHKGGTNHLNFNSYHAFRANYHKNKIRFNNSLEWRLSLYNAPDDSVRSYRIGNDLLRYYGDFGVNSFVKGWSYSTNLEAKSQMFNNFIPNTENIRSAFLAPLYVNFGIGLKFEMNKKSEKVRHRKLKWTLALAPASFNYKYVGHSEVDVKRYGIPEGKKSILDIGSTITSIVKYNITRYITWDSRFTYFTSYEKVVSEFENSLNMALSNAFSTRLYLNLRFDDGVPPDPDFNYWQMNQTLSFGLNFKW